MQNPMIQNLVQFTHLEKTYGYLPGIGEATLAALFGLDEATYREIKAHFDENARESAQELLGNSSLAERVDRLPFRFAIASFVREQDEPVVDLQTTFGTPADPALQGPDGVHPSLAGQKAIAKAFVERLTP